MMRILIYVGLSCFYILPAISATALESNQDMLKYEQEIKKDPNNLYAHMDLMQSYFDADKADEILKIYQAKSTKNPSDPVSHYAIGRLYVYSEKFDIALGELSKARQLGMKSKWLNYEFARAYYGLGDNAKVIKSLAASADDEMPMAYEILALSNYELKKYEESVRWAYKALKLDPKSSVRELAGTALLLTGRPKESISVFEDGLALNSALIKQESSRHVLALAYLKSAQTSTTTVNGDIIYAAGKKHPELLNDKQFGEVYSKVVAVVKQSDSRLPKSIRGIALGQSISEVDKTAEERKLRKNIYYGGTSNDSRFYDLQYSDTDFLSLAVRLENDKVNELEATYNESMGAYNEIVALAQQNLGKPDESVQWQSDDKRTWYWRTTWIDDSVVIRILANSETKDPPRYARFMVTDRRAYETDQQRAKKFREKKGKKMFGGD